MWKRKHKQHKWSLMESKQELQDKGAPRGRRQLGPASSPASSPGARNGVCETTLSEADASWKWSLWPSALRSDTCIGRKRTPRRQGADTRPPYSRNTLSACALPLRRTGSWKKVCVGSTSAAPYSAGNRGFTSGLCAERGFVEAPCPDAHTRTRRFSQRPRGKTPRLRGCLLSGTRTRSGPPTAAAAHPNTAAFGGTGILTKPDEAERRPRHGCRGTSHQDESFHRAAAEGPRPQRKGSRQLSLVVAAGPLQHRRSGWEARVGRARAREQTPPGPREHTCVQREG